MHVYRKLRVDSNNRLRKWYTYGSSALFFICVLVAFLSIVRDGNFLVQNAKKDALVLAKTLSAHATQLYSRMDTVSQIVSDDALAISETSSLQSVLRRRAESAMDIVAITVLDSTGRVRASSLESLEPDTDMSFIPAFNYFKANLDAVLRISPPGRYHRSKELSEDPEAHYVSITHRINDRTGSFYGLSIVSLRADYVYRSLSDDIPLGPMGVISLVGTEDGIVRAHSSNPDLIGRMIAPHIEELIEQKEGSYLARGVLTNVWRFYGFSLVQGYPLIVFVGIGVRPVLVSFLINSGIVVLILTVLGTVLLIGKRFIDAYIKKSGTITAQMITVLNARREKAFFESILQTTSAIVLVCDGQGRLRVGNARLDALLEHLELPSTDSKSVFMRLFGSNFEEICSAAPFSIDVSVEAKDISKLSITWAISSILDEFGRLVNLVAIGFDTTELKAAEQSVQQSSRLVTLGELATGLAHELNQPLAAIGMTADNLAIKLQTKLYEEASIVRSIERIQNNVDRASKIIDHMKIFGRRGDGKLRRVKLSDAIDGALTIMKPKMRLHDIHLVEEYCADHDEIIGDITLLEQIILNFVGNAVDALAARAFDEKNSEWIPQIKVGLTSEGNTVVLYVADNAGGVPEDILTKIFEPFFTTKPVGSGTGLGLSLSFGIVRDLSGTLKVVNENDGAIFYATFPVAEARYKFKD